MAKVNNGMPAPQSPQLRIMAIRYLLDDAERSGLALSMEVQAVVERQCASLFDYNRDPASAVSFSRTLKEIAVRLFRQRRYREADARYRMASTFNPADPTLVSNRATCMYNLARFRACADLCMDCLNQYTSLLYENPLLYFKVLLRMGRAYIELKDFTAAQTTYKALCDLKNGICAPGDVKTPDEQLSDMLVTFAKHLNAKRESRGVNGSGGAASAAAHGESGDDDDFDERKDENVHGTIELSDLCPHVYEYGDGECTHPFPPGDHGPNCNCEQHEGEISLEESASYNSENDSTPSLASSGDGQNASEESLSEDTDVPDLVSDEEGIPESTDDDDDDDDYYSDEDECSDEGREGERSSTCIPVEESKNGKRVTTECSGQTNKQARVEREPSGSAPIDWRNAWKDGGSSASKVSSTSRSPSSTAIGRASSTGGSSSKSGTEPGGFKRGFLRSRQLIVDRNSSSSGPSGLRVAVSPVSMKWSSTCYESDQETGPVGSGLLGERPEEDKALYAYERTMPPPPRDTSFDASGCLREVLGRSFYASRTIDFTRLFGPHQLSAAGGKKKKKTCDKHCGTCFARKLWKLRFKSSDAEEAENALAAMEKDTRRNHQTFLARELWQGTGYYGSGHEMAFDIPALLHGAAYACHLQSELQWRGDKITFVRDVQHSLISALQRKYDEERNLHFLYMIFFMIRDTVNLFGLFPDGKDDRTRRSFQFSNCTSAVTEKLSSKEGASGSASRKTQALLGSQSQNLAQNIQNWAVLGQVAREEEWVYNILLRDVSHLVMSITGTVSKAPSYLEGESFSKAFEKACGERASDERYWKNRVVTIVTRERSRLLERNGYEAKTSGDLENSASFYTLAIQARPRQARLYYRRALVRAEQGKVRESLNDIQKGIQVVNERPQAITSTRCDSPHKCLLQSLYMLEGDIFMKKNNDTGHSVLETIKAAIESYTKALHMKSDDKSSTELVQEKLDLAKSSYEKAQRDERRPGLSANGHSQSPHAADKEVGTSTLRLSGRSQTSGHYGKALLERREQWHGNSSARHTGNESDPSAVDSGKTSRTLNGNRYGALVGNAGSSRAPQPNRTARMRGSPSGNAESWATVGRRINRASHSPAQTPSPQQTSADRGGIQGLRCETSQSALASGQLAANVLPTAVPSSGSNWRFHCHSCDMRFSSRRDYESHHRGRRHRTAIAQARVSRTVATTPNRVTQEGRRGPNLQEVATEAERAMVILGGEARPSDVVIRMNFSRWDIHDVNGYLDAHFGGLLQICNQHPQTFEVVHGSRSRTMILLVDRTGFASPRHRNNTQRISQSARAFNTGPTRSLRRTPGLGSSSSGVSDVTAMLNDVSLSNRKGDEVITGAYDEGECGICLDNKEDIRIIPCHHKWCERCIMANIAKGRVVCPKCNGPVHNLERLASELD